MTNKRKKARASGKTRADCLHRFLRGEHQKGWKRSVFKGPHGETIEVKGP